MKSIIIQDGKLTEGDGEVVKAGQTVIRKGHWEKLVGKANATDRVKNEKALAAILKVEDKRAKPVDPGKKVVK